MWNRNVLSLEWKKEGVVDSVMVAMNEIDGMKQEVYSKDWVMHNGMSDL